MAIVITQDGKNAEKLDRTSFKDENYLQNYIYENPDSVPLYEIDENIRLLILAREFPTNSGPIDAIGIDYKGEIYVIETKLYKNPDKRLVVAQVLDYGAALSFNYRDFSEFLQVLETKVSQHFRTNLHQTINDFFGLSDDTTVEVVENMKTNLDKGKFRFVVLMDSLEKRLKDLIVFLNQNSRFDIYGVELEYYKYKDFEIMIPKLFGAEVKKQINVASTSGGARRKWDENSFFEEAEDQLTKEQVSAIKDIYDYSKKTADKITWGTGSQNGSYSAIYTDICPRSLFSIYTNGNLAINHSWMDEDEQMKSYRDKLVNEIRQIFSIPADQPLRTLHIEDWADKVAAIRQSVEKLKE